MRDISVVLCTYNGERFVRSQLESILAQTAAPAEVIVGDDGSTDGTVAIVQAVAGSTSVPVRLHRNERRLGFADNFLATCRRATQPYVALSDQDDEWAPTKLEAAREALRLHRADLCVHPVHLMDARGVRTGSNRPRRARTRIVPASRLDPWGNFYGFTMMFRRALLNRIPDTERGLDPHVPEADLSHDRWVYFLASTFGTTVVLDECLAAYRQHGGQLYGGESPRGFRERVAAKLANGQRQASYLADIAAHRAAVLRSFIPRSDGAQDLSAWVAGAARWAALEIHQRNRARLYDGVSSGRRIVLLAENMRE